MHRTVLVLNNIALMHSFEHYSGLYPCTVLVASMLGRSGIVKNMEKVPRRIPKVLSSLDPTQWGVELDAPWCALRPSHNLGVPACMDANTLPTAYNAQALSLAFEPVSGTTTINEWQDSVSAQALLATGQWQQEVQYIYCHGVTVARIPEKFYSATCMTQQISHIKYRRR